MSENVAARPNPIDAPEPAAAPAQVAAPFEPVVLAFTCNWCSYRAADLAGTARIKYPPNVRLVRLMCSRTPRSDLRAEGVRQRRGRRAHDRLLAGRLPLPDPERQGAPPLRAAAPGARAARYRARALPARLRQRGRGPAARHAFARIIEEVRPLGPLGWGRLPDVGPESETPEALRTTRPRLASGPWPAPNRSRRWRRERQRQASLRDVLGRVCGGCDIACSTSTRRSSTSPSASRSCSGRRSWTPSTPTSRRCPTARST